jgi:hypothetical protein
MASNATEGKKICELDSQKMCADSRMIELKQCLSENIESENIGMA